ncbi:MAG: acyloxyacyl hydrolase [Saprospiraceae bacterium]|nr:acyloxyacyl hydrolase [Saprospiraceae bacterium]
MQRLVCLFLIACSFLCSATLLAQDTIASPRRDAFSGGLRLHRGFIIPHSKAIADLATSNPFGFEINAQWLLQDPIKTRRLGLVSKRGFAAHYVHFDNPEVLGQTFAFVPWVEPLIRPWRPLYGSVRLGLGPAWLTRLYDPETNPDNLFFSFPLSLWAMLNAHLHYKIGNQWEIAGGINYNHISNGGMRNPNKGMNFPTFNLGFQYYPQPVQILKPEKNRDWKNSPRNYAYLLAVGTVKNMDPAPPEHPDVQPCWSAGAMGVLGRQVGRFSHLSVGTEWIHDGFAREMLSRNGLQKSAWKGSLLAGHELIVGRVTFAMHLGAYLFNPSGDPDPVYQRYGLYYRAGQHLMFGSSMKAHRHVADVFDIRVGWLWR